MEIGEKYNWVNQPERLVYVGKSGCWHQFEKVDNPGTVWCEVLDSDLRMLEKTKHPCDVGEKDLDHDYEWQDDSFDHEFGTEICGHWECINCGDVNSDSEPPSYDEPEDYDLDN